MGKIIEERDLLTDDGIVVCEYEEGRLITNLKLWKERNYGFKKISILKK